MRFKEAPPGRSPEPRRRALRASARVNPGDRTRLLALVLVRSFASIESQIRVLADYAFMLRDYELALSNYRLLATDYKLDKAWKRYAGVQLMHSWGFYAIHAGNDWPLLLYAGSVKKGFRLMILVAEQFVLQLLTLQFDSVYIKVFLTERQDPYCPIHTGPTADRYVDRPLPGGTAKIGRRQSISTVDGRFPSSMVDLRRNQPSTVVCGRKRKEEEEEKKKRSTSRRPRVAHEPSLPTLP
ncbi:hypothetical protein GW17_00007968 [Ensete ventricosum]|nr:hypothetical protein GW17_00007968 [Ensete ventricosum]